MRRQHMDRNTRRRADVQLLARGSGRLMPIPDAGIYFMIMKQSVIRIHSWHSWYCWPIGVAARSAASIDSLLNNQLFRQKVKEAQNASNHELVKSSNRFEGLSALN
jgi:hypothetical protein